MGRRFGVGLPLKAGCAKLRLLDKSNTPSFPLALFFLSITHMASKVPGAAISGCTSNTDVERASQKRHSISLWEYLMQDVDPKETAGPLSAFCFMTGYMCVLFYFLSCYDKIVLRRVKLVM
jgi:hypothetical protein